MIDPAATASGVARFASRITRPKLSRPVPPATYSTSNSLPGWLTMYGWPLVALPKSLLMPPARSGSPTVRSKSSFTSVVCASAGTAAARAAAAARVRGVLVMFSSSVVISVRGGRSARSPPPLESPALPSHASRWM